ncbi:MAG: hypothetical protein ATN31_01260 [Candidatus Epulonipiscioides saccharophilum]|nr:MAG: hypothetical protein ATN31_01260 [Epulopiscium sp. AS2M-Bin001]
MHLMVLGGGQNVGASCYFLKLGQSNIILDAGIGIDKEGLIYTPNIHALKTSPFISSLSQINEIFISHAHLDHVGYLTHVAKESTQANTYMTAVTKALTKYQLYDKVYKNEKAKELERLATKSILDGIISVTYTKTIKFRNYTATFFPAGHIPGAMMILFEYRNHKILYTGDYSISDSPLTNGGFDLSGYNIDTMIMCGLHAKHSSYVKNQNAIYKIIEKIYKQIFIGKSVYCQVNQLTKGVEFLKLLNDFNQHNTLIYIDENLLNVIEKLEIPILNNNVRLYNPEYMPDLPHVYITSRKASKNSHNSSLNYFDYFVMNIDFSLHVDFAEIKSFVNQVNARHVYMVHCEKQFNPMDYDIEQAMIRESDCRSQFIFIDNQEIYKL